MSGENTQQHHYASEAPPAYEPPNPYAPYDPSKEQPSAPPPPPPGHGQFPPSPYMSGTTVVMQPTPGFVPTVFVGPYSFGEEPQSMQCPNCHNQIVTGTRPKSGLLAWLVCGGLTLFACWLCCCIPFFCTRCQDIEHYCPKCKRLLGCYRRI